MNKKILPIMLIILLLLSTFIVLNNNNVNASSVNGNSLYGLDSNQGYYAYTNSKTAYCTDNKTLIYDGNGILVYTFLQSDDRLGYGSTPILQQLSSIVNFNESTIMIATTFNVKDVSGNYQTNLDVFLLNLDTFDNQTIVNNQQVNGAGMGIYYNLHLKIIYLNGAYYIISELQKLMSANPQNFYFAIIEVYPSYSIKNRTDSGQTTNQYVYGSSAVYVASSTLTNVIYLLSQTNTTGLELWSINLGTGTCTRLISKITITQNNLINTITNYIFLISHDYNSVTIGNYTLAIAKTEYNSTFNGLSIMTMIFDDIGYNSTQGTTITINGMFSPLRIFGAISSSMTYLDTWNLYAVDSTYKYRYLPMSFSNNGSIVSVTPDTNFGIAPIMVNGGADAGFSYVDIETFSLVSSNIGGFQDLNNNDTNQLIFMVDYTNGIVDVQKNIFTIQGLGLYMLIQDSGDGNTFTLSELQNNGYVTYVIYSRQGLFDKFPFAQPVYYFECKILNNGVYGQYDGYYNVYVSDVKLTPYTYSELQSVQSGAVSDNGQIINGTFEYVYRTGTPTGEPDYYYQLIVIMGSYEVSENVFQTITSYVFIVAHKYGEPEIPTGLPDDYTPVPSTDDGADDDTDDENIGTNVIIPVEYWIIILIYMIFSILLGLIAGKEGLVVGLIIATIICLIASLIPLWVIIPVILALIVLILKETGVLSSNEGT